MNKRLIAHLMENSSKKCKGKLKTKGGRKKAKQNLTRNRFKTTKAYQHMDYLSLLGKSKNKQRLAKLLELATAPEIAAVMECISNLHHNHGVMGLSPAVKGKLQKHSAMVKKLYYPRTGVEKRKTILSTEGIKGGLLLTLIPISLRRALFHDLLNLEDRNN